MAQSKGFAVLRDAFVGKIFRYDCEEGHLRGNHRVVVTRIELESCSMYVCMDCLDASVEERAPLDSSFLHSISPDLGALCGEEEEKLAEAMQKIVKYRAAYACGKPVQPRKPRVQRVKDYYCPPELWQDKKR